MSALHDAKRYLWLKGCITDDQPDALLRDLVSEVERNRSRPLASQLESRVADLEGQLKQANERTRLVEHKNVQLEEQLRSDRLWKRIKELESEVKKANERTRLVEHQLVVASQTGSRNKRT